LPQDELLVSDSVATYGPVAAPRADDKAQAELMRAGRDLSVAVPLAARSEGKHTT